MPRNMSFMLTTEQARARTKVVTRRLGWWFLMPGDIVQQVEKGMGLKKGQKVKKIHLIEIVSTRGEPLKRMLDDAGYGILECGREGFPHLSPSQFVDMFCRHNKCSLWAVVNRIRFRYLP